MANAADWLPSAMLDLELLLEVEPVAVGMVKRGVEDEAVPASDGEATLSLDVDVLCCE